MPYQEIEKYLRLDKLPHIWCPGCGNGIILQGVLRAVLKLNLDQDKVAVVSGIGCSSRSGGYMDFNTLHTTHGRAISFATGVKLAKPELTTLVMTGDGDCAAIGGNHLIHAARRNIDLTVVVFNNSIYGMTGGQYSPTTAVDRRASTAPHGNIENPFDLCDLARAAGATFVARATTFHAALIPILVAKGIQNKGFSFIEVITQCPIYYGRMNRMADPVDMLKWQRDCARNMKQWSIMTEEEKMGKFVIGELHYKPAPEYTERYRQLRERDKEIDKQTKVREAMIAEQEETGCEDEE